MSNASAASRAATKPKAAPAAVEPELPFDHPERLVTELLAKDSPVAWKLPMHLAHRFPHLQFGAEIAAGVLRVTSTVPIVAQTLTEQSRFRLAPNALAVELTLRPDTIQTTISACLTVGIECDALDAVARLTGQRLSELMELPRGARPFIERWAMAFRDLTGALVEMWWQANALESNRDAVHRARKLVRDQMPDIAVRWTGDRSEGAARA